MMRFPRTATFCIRVGAVQVPVCRPAQKFGRREYGSAYPREGQKPSGSRGPAFALGALIAAVPAAYYMKSGLKPRDGDGSASAEREQTRFSDSTSTTGGSLGQPPSTVDPANSRKEPGGPSTVSGKQEGISNTTSSNPYMSQPEKSKKGEGETETVKVKGTVSPERPQT